ncbi:FkbM family methyltransferase [Halorubrum sp. T3]|uniref:FkbM family methyltransferase n=1 Tax=Halorubrum sp. T3 TaxID=1194088 RepID=UPI00178C7AB6|nr:FkbM family methyltransferase [Halorubrum sp. T3]
MKELSLNDVTVPVEIYPIDRYIPFYELPYHTEDYPMYEQTEVEALQSYVTEGDDVVVIGGGFGVTAVVASRVTGGTVTVFEPDANRFEILRRVVEANDNRSKINLNHAIVSQVNSSVVESKAEPDPEFVSPEELPDADVFEIDCEGAETTILKQMKARPSVILVETHNNHDEVAQILRDIGYNIVDVVKDGVEQHPNCTHIRARLA